MERYRKRRQRNPIHPQWRIKRNPLFIQNPIWGCPGYQSRGTYWCCPCRLFHHADKLSHQWSRFYPHQSADQCHRNVRRRQHHYGSPEFSSRCSRPRRNAISWTGTQSQTDLPGLQAPQCQDRIIRPTHSRRRHPNRLLKAKQEKRKRKEKKGRTGRKERRKDATLASPCWRLLFPPYRHGSKLLFSYDSNYGFAFPLERHLESFETFHNIPVQQVDVMR